MLVACDDGFLDSALTRQNKKSADIFNLSMRLLDGDLARLLGRAYSHTEASILSGLLSARRVAGLDDTRIDSSIIANTRVMDARYAKLAFCCGNQFLYGNRYNRHDLRVMSLLGIRIKNYRFFNSAKYNAPHVDNVVGVWPLVDGGVVKPSDIILPYLTHAKRIIIYDRYTTAAAIGALEDCFSVLQNRLGGGTLNISTTIYIGGGQPNFGPVEIISRLQSFFGSGLLKVFKSGKSAGQADFVHDRYFQVDNRLTFELSAGLSSFMRPDGLAVRNRAATIVLHNLCIGSSQVSIKELPSQNTVTILR